MVQFEIHLKTKADLEDLAKTEADINYLKQKVDDLGGQINRQHEENLASTHDSRNQPQQCGYDHVFV